jgi:2-isopropylmalate synthase
VVARASVAVTLGEDTEPVRATATGNGPVNALDAAVRSALAGRVDWLDRVRLLDYSVRILGPVGVPAQAGQHLGDPEGAAAAGAAGSGVAGHGTGAVTRVLAITGDGDAQWSTVGVHANVIEASWLALADAWAHAALRYATPAG